MRSFLSAVVFLFVSAVAAVSTTGNRLLVVLDDVAEKEQYKQFFGDLSGKFMQRRRTSCEYISMDGTDETYSIG